MSFNILFYGIFFVFCAVTYLWVLNYQSFLDSLLIDLVQTFIWLILALDFTLKWIGNPKISSADLFSKGKHKYILSNLYLFINIWDLS